MVLGKVKKEIIAPMWDPCEQLVFFTDGYRRGHIWSKAITFIILLLLLTNALTTLVPNALGLFISIN